MSKHFLQVNDFSSITSSLETWNQSISDLKLDRIRNEVLKRPGVEFIASYFPLRGPEMAINIKDTITKEIMQDGVESMAFHKIVKVGAEKVVQIGRISSANAVREVQETSYLESKRRGGAEHVSDPVMKTVAVLDQSNEVSDERIRFRTRGSGVRLVVEQESDDDDEQGDDEE